MPQTPEEQKAIVQRMIDAGETEENIATVIQHFGSSAPPEQKSLYGKALDFLNAAPFMPHPKDLSKLLEWLPAAGGAAGGIIGGSGGTVLGMGVGGVPGAVGGATIGGAGGEAVRQLGHRVLGDTVPTSAMDAAKKIALQGGIQGGSEVVGGAFNPLLKHGAGVLMQSAVKPSIKNTARALVKGLSIEDAPVVKTLIKEGVNVSPGGIAKLGRIINATNDEIKSAISTIPGKVQPSAVATRTEQLASDVAKQVDPEDDISAVQGVTRRFLNQEGTTKAGQVGTKIEDTGVLDASGRMTTRDVPVMGRVSRPLTLTEAQEMKTGTYRALKDKAYGEMKGPAIEANKALARGLKEEIELEAKKSGVDLARMNAREGAAITARDAVAQRVAAAGNRDPVALAWLAANPTAGLLFIMERSPAVKSMLAHGLYKSASRAARVPENVIRTVVSAIAASGQDNQEGAQ